MYALFIVVPIRYISCAQARSQNYVHVEYTRKDWFESDFVLNKSIAEIKILILKGIHERFVGK